jgi:hypothetical protein
MRTLSLAAILFLLHFTKDQIYVFLEKEMCSLSPNSYIPVSVSDCGIGPHIWLQKICGPILEIYKSLTDI